MSLEIPPYYPESCILVVSSYDAAPFSSNLLVAGAMGFVSKDGSKVVKCYTCSGCWRTVLEFQKI